MADNQAIREGTGKLTLVRSVELEGGIHIPVYALADAEGNLLGTSSAPLPVSGKTGYNLKRISTSFTRPTDTNTYAIGDAITNSTSAPTVFEWDLSTIGAVAGQAIEVRKLAVVSSISPALKLLANVFLSSTTFSATNDNSALSIDDTTMELGGSWFNCDLQNSTTLNHTVAYSGIAQPLVLAAADTKLYGTIQAANAYVPGNAEKFTIIAWIALL